MSYFYHLGGKVPLDSSTYIPRQADDDLYEELLKGSFCYVLASRQMGKSSLQVRVKNRLEEENVRRCVTIDFTGIGSDDSTANSWYRGISRRLITELKLQKAINIKGFWQENSELSPLNKFSVFIEEVLSNHVTESLVIFFDEIDTTIRLDFTDDFFAWIRYCYQSRQDSPDSYYKRITFCLLGVAKPEDLIKAKERTPFNIGEAIELLPFQEEQLDPLMVGLQEKTVDLNKVRHEIYYWTGGQPFLTQRLCELIQSKLGTIEPEREAELIAKLVENNIINSWEFDLESDKNSHLNNIQKELLKDEEKAIKILGLYQQILESEGLTEIVTSKDNLPEIATLRLAGLIVSVQGRFSVYNEIYKRVFNTAWVERELARLRPYAASLNLWLKSDRNDKYLLSGKAFSDAQQWSLKRRLTELDSQYLAASQKIETERVRVEAEKKIEKAEKEAKQIINKATKQATLFTVGSVVASMVVVGIAWFNYSELSWRSSIERDNTEALNLSIGSLDRMIAAIKVGRKLQRKVKSSHLADYPAYSPLATLRESLVNSWQETNSFSGHQYGLAISGDGQTIISGGGNNTVKVWKRNGTLVTTLTGHQDSVSSVAISADGNTLVSGSLDKTAKVWKLNGTLITTLVGHQSGVSNVVISADGQTIVSTSLDDTAKVWKRDGTLITTLKGQNRFHDAAISADGQTIVSVSASRQDRTVKVWRQDGSLISTLTGHQDSVSSVAVSSDGQIIVSGSVDGTVNVWKQDGSLISTLTGHQGAVSNVAISANGQIIISGGFDRTVKVWKPDGALVTTFPSHLDKINSVAINNDGQTIASMSGDKTVTVKVWQRDDFLTSTFNGHQDSVHGVAISSDGQTTVSGGNDGTVKVWKRDGSLISTFNGHQNIVYGVAISADGQTVISGDVNTAKVWKRDGNFIATLTDHQKPVTSVAISADGQTVISGGNDGTVKVWKRDGSLISTFTGYQGSVNSVAISADGQTIISGGENNTVKIWKRDGNLITTLTDHQKPVTSVAISADSRIITSGGGDNTVKVWRRDGTPITTLTGHRSRVKSVAISADGQTVISGDGDDTGKIWHFDLDYLLNKGCELAKDYLKNHPEENKDSMCPK
jgi:WD40 repeat protein